MLAETKDRKSHPLAGSCQEAIPLLHTTFDNFSGCVAQGTLPPLGGLRRTPVCLIVVPAAWAPHQPPIRLKAHGRLVRAPDVGPWHALCPRKPSVPCRVHACTAYRSHGSRAGPPFPGLTAEASHDSTIRW